VPIYEYQCQECGTKTEVLVRAQGPSVTCPSCGSPLLEKLFSVPYVMSADTARPKGRTCCGQAERCASPPCTTEQGCRRE
jgi:putative FmdB family regulatory protein